MEIVKIKCSNGANYSILNEYWETSSSWGHKSTLLDEHGHEIESNKVRYINRTWECYRYQTCMSGLINKILDTEQKQFIERYKENNGISRLTTALKKQLLQELCEQEYIKELLEIKEKISNKNFD